MLFQMQNTDSQSALTVSINSDDRRIFRTLELICGTVEVRPTCDTSFNVVEIELLGTAKTTGRRVVAEAPFARDVTTSHRFLKLEQPDVHLFCPNDRVFRAGCVYRMPFKFAIPEHTLPTTCCHSPPSSSQVNYRLHTTSPPSFGDQTSNEQTDFAPRGSSVRYCIVVRVKAPAESNLASASPSPSKVETCRRVRFLPSHSVNHPTVKSWSQATIGGQTNAIKKHWIRPLGQMVLGFANTTVLHMTLASSGLGYGELRGEMVVGLFFYPFSDQTSPPSHGSVRGCLRATTHVSVCPLPHPRFRILSPESEEDIHSAPKIKFPELTLQDLDWSTSTLPLHSSNQNAPGTTRYYATQIMVPIHIKLHFPLVPTFDSCLLSRKYNLNLELSMSTMSLSGSSSMRFTLPVRVASIFRSQGQSHNESGHHGNTVYQRMESSEVNFSEGGLDAETFNDYDGSPVLLPGYKA